MKPSWKKVYYPNGESKVIIPSEESEYECRFLEVPQPTLETTTVLMDRHDAEVLQRAIRMYYQ